MTIASEVTKGSQSATAGSSSCDASPISTRSRGTRLVSRWMRDVGRSPFAFQREVWTHIRSGKSGLLHSPTGTGKTLAVWLGAIADWIDRTEDLPEHLASPANGRRLDASDVKIPARRHTEPIQVLWITPLRALAADTRQALEQPIEDLKLPWSVENRTSDTTSHMKAKQIKRLPTCLITTPESLSILLSHSQSHDQLGGVQLVVLDEWHELMGSKRGVLTELCLARIRGMNPQVKTWALSATIGNIREAMTTALGPGESESPAELVSAKASRKISIRSAVPKNIERFPWAGHMGLRSVPMVVEQIETAGSTLVFTNTRSQAEKWYAALLAAKPEWAGVMGVHHGSLDRKRRDWVEKELDAGNLKCVVCTSSLDLGVDFLPVEKVLQVGSPKGVARLMQRAGRSGHYPGGKSQVLCVPTHALELVEVSAAKDSIRQGRIESRWPLAMSLDVLAQHVVTLACSGKCTEQEIRDEVRKSNAFRELTNEQWGWVMEFVQSGGSSLKAYPDYRRVAIEDGRLVVPDKRMVRRHRMTIGTIPSDQEVLVKFAKGGTLGTIEESFVSKLNPGDLFTFAGRTLRLVSVRDMTAWVKRAKGSVAALPRWQGGRMPLSTELSEAVRSKLGDASRGIFDGPEMKAIRPLLELQSRWSGIPDEDSLLIERVKTRDGFHTFIYPFEGRLVHEGLAALLAWRLGRIQPITFANTINDYGIELLSPSEPLLEKALQDGLLSPDGLLTQISQCMNASELDRRQFRDIARISGLIFNGFPGQAKTSKQLQASSNMFFDVFSQYDPANLLLRQARQEVLDLQLEFRRLSDALQRLSQSKIVLRYPPKPTPLAFPILVDRLRTRLSSEKLADRIERLTRQYEKEAQRGERTRQRSK